MLITEMKAKETLVSLTDGKKVFIINCEGCKEVHFPGKEAKEFQKELISTGRVTGTITTDYICNPDNMKLRLSKHMSEIEAADAVLVFSCGVGVQTISAYLEDKPVYAACDTYPLPGFQGVTPLEYQCDQCGECWLNLTGGNLPDYSMLQEPGERTVRRFQGRHVRGRQQHGMRLGAYPETPGADRTSGSVKMSDECAEFCYG